jgi:hypothetical protein
MRSFLLGGFCLVFIAILFLSCGDGLRNPKFSFYYWKTEMRFSSEEQNLLRDLQVNHLYVKYFDIDWDEVSKAPKPIAVSQYFLDREKPYSLPEITPCIFITNKTIEKSDFPGLDRLAKNIYTKVNSLSSDYFDHYLNTLILQEKNASSARAQDSLRVLAKRNWKSKLSEIQFDCDWTTGSREKYFYLLTKLKEAFSDKKISCTLRLWQLKYREKAGIPPTDRCLVMCYSTGSPRDLKTKNSISSYNEVRSYFVGQKYPLACDYALPIYSWVSVFRNGRFVNLMIGLSENMAAQHVENYKKTGEHLFVVQADHVYGDQYLRYGDLIRFEKVDYPELESMLKLIKEKGTFDEGSKISFFSWDTFNIKQYGTQKLKNLYHSFR